MLPVLMMLPEPWRIIAGAAYFMPSTTPRRWVAMTVSKCSMSISAMPARRPGLPALLKRQSRRPNLASACSISDLTSGSLVTSVRTKAAVVPSFFANPSPSAWRRPAMTTLAPSSTNSSAVRAPMPLVPPVMIATLPSSAPISSLPISIVRLRLHCRRQVGQARVDRALRRQARLRPGDRAGKAAGDAGAVQGGRQAGADVDGGGEGADEGVAGSGGVDRPDRQGADGPGVGAGGGDGALAAQSDDHGGACHAGNGAGGG